MASTPFPPPPPAPAVPPLDRIKHVHLSAVAGTGMGALAGMLRSLSLKVSGSDQNIYPPMSTQLADAGIELKLGYKPENLKPVPDLVIVGNALSRGNPEIEALLSSGIPYVSFPAALSKFFLAGRHSVVIAGTHGKTTTCSIAAWLLESAGKDPGFLIGGVPKNFGRGNKLGKGSHFVVEGDEYDTAFFDKESKFLHYQPRTALVTSVEFDHADIYRDLEHVKSAFIKFMKLVPADGLLVVNADDPGAMDCAKRAEPKARVETYSLSASADWTIGDLAWKDGRASFVARKSGESFSRVSLPLLGKHNLSNTLGVIAALSREIAPDAIARGLASFQGVKRRQEVRGVEDGVTVIDDFAHHPTAVKVTLEALRAGYPGRRLWAIFEPRSASSRRKVFQQAYGEAFDAADQIVIADTYLAEKLAAEQRFDPKELVAGLVARGKSAEAIPSANEIVERIVPRVKTGDVLAVLSNGGFDDIHAKLLSALASRAIR